MPNILSILGPKILTAHPERMILGLWMSMLVLASAQDSPQCYPLSSSWLPINVNDCADVFERILGESTAMTPFPLNQERGFITFPYSRKSGSCRLRMDLLHDNANGSFSLMQAVTAATDIARTCLIPSGNPSLGGQSQAGPTASEVSISLGGCVRSASADNSAHPGPHGIRIRR